jgi:hypothetical protein
MITLKFKVYNYKGIKGLTRIVHSYGEKAERIYNQYFNNNREKDLDVKLISFVSC